MSFIDRRNETRPSSGEAPFHLNEVFFSRTDERGVIQSANYIFRRVAHYDWSELIGAPHKRIRHPDMPKGVFWLLWDTIQKGEAMGAYVNNLAKDGLNYWVFATVMPCPGGYLSTRIKPTSPTLDVVKSLYADLLRAEKEQGLSPEESAALLQERIRDLGFDSYSHFAAHALSEELISRDEGLGNIKDRMIRKSRQTLENAAKLEQETYALIEEFQTMRTIPHNMRVIASRLEPTGGPVSTLSQNYGAMSHEISDWFEQHVNGPDSNFTTIKDSTNTAMFLRCMARIITESDIQLERERRKLGDFDIASERALLNDLRAHYEDLSKKRTAMVLEEAGKIIAACRIMHRQVLGLSTTRVMCKIEGARVSVQGESLRDIILQLETFQTRIRNRLDAIQQIAEQIHAG